MSIRQAINRNPAIAAIVSVIALGAVVAVVFATRSHEASGAKSAGGAKAWYTVDDGRTYFPDDANRLVPFDHNGKPAYRCYVWTCDAGTNRFVSHLERLTEQGRRSFAGSNRMDVLQLVPGTLEVKAPLTGDTGWVVTTSPQAEQIQTPRCRNDRSRVPQPVQPPQ